MAYPFYPMTDEMLKKLTLLSQESDQIIYFPDFPSELASQEFKSASEINPSHLETDSLSCLTYNRY